MKFNYGFPYNFSDLREPDQDFVFIDHDQTEIKFQFIDLPFYSTEQIEVCIEIESSSTFFRKLFPVESINTILRLNQKDLGSIIEYSIFIVAKRTGEISFNDYTEYYEFGDCIGVIATDTVRVKEEEELSSLIKVGATDGESVEFDLTSDWITISLPRETYKQYVYWQKDDKHTPYILASLGFGAIEYAILKALQDDTYKQKEWWQILRSMDENIEEKEDEIPGVTNKLLGGCFERMLEAAFPNIDLEDTSILS